MLMCDHPPLLFSFTINPMEDVFSPCWCSKKNIKGKTLAIAFQTALHKEKQQCHYNIARYWYVIHEYNCKTWRDFVLISNCYIVCGLVCNMFIFIPLPPPPPYVLFFDFPSPPPPPPLCIKVDRKSPVSGFFVQFFPLISCLLICPLLIFSSTWLNHHFWVIF